VNSSTKGQRRSENISSHPERQGKKVMREGASPRLTSRKRKRHTAVETIFVCGG
jgi:hypothetical protein